VLKREAAHPRRADEPTAAQARLRRSSEVRLLGDVRHVHEVADRDDRTVARPHLDEVARASVALALVDREHLTPIEPRDHSVGRATRVIGEVGADAIAAAGLMQAWIEDLHARLALPEARAGAVLLVADTGGEFLQRFEAIHPFVDGNGRTGRLVANYVNLSLGQMLIVFRARERPAFYAAHRSKPAMKLFIADKLREVAISPFTGELSLVHVGSPQSKVPRRGATLRKRLCENSPTKSLATVRLASSNRGYGT
jgi:hypothetical protein